MMTQFEGVKISHSGCPKISNHHIGLTSGKSIAKDCAWRIVAPSAHALEKEMVELMLEMGEMKRTETKYPLQ